MTPWDARDLLTAQDPDRALRAHAVDPLPPRPKPCSCADEDKVEAWNLDGSRDLYCSGRCR